MYAHCREVGITLITISHRQTLWQYHQYMLRFEDEHSDDAGKGKLTAAAAETKAKRVVTFRAMNEQDVKPAR